MSIRIYLIPKTGVIKVITEIQLFAKNFDCFTYNNIYPISRVAISNVHELSSV